MLVPFHEMIKDAHLRHYAVGAFNCLSVENAIGAISAAENLNSPIILQLAEVQFPQAPMELLAPVFLTAAKRARIPVAVHLDHGQSLETCIRAIQAGFNSIMFDGADLPFEENVRISSIAAKLAHACGVDMEAELGKVGDASSAHGGAPCNGDIFTDVSEAMEFVSRTGTDALAVAIGNLHGKYISTPQLNIGRLQELDGALDIPMVLHGGSGTSTEDFKACIKNGISKINVATAIQTAVADKISEYVRSGVNHSYITMKSLIIEASEEAVASHILLFESNGKA